MLIFDRDGTLYTYDYAVYNDKQNLWTDPNTHVFMKDKIFEGMKELLNWAIVNNIEFCVLSKMPENLPESTLNVMALDKLMHFANDGINIWKGDIHFTKLDKAAYFVKMTGRLPNKSDILFSDYQPELESWMLIGGSSVKVLNGVNSLTHWNGCSINALNPGESIINSVIAIRKNLYEGGIISK